MTPLFKFSTMRSVLGLPLTHLQSKILWLDLLRRFGVDPENTTEMREFTDVLNRVVDSLDDGSVVSYDVFIKLTERHTFPHFCEVSGF